MSAYRDFPIYLIVLGTTLAGMLSMSWWVAVIGGCALSLKLMAEDRVRPDGDIATYDVALVTTNLVISVVVTPLAYLGGRLIAAVWGL